MVPKLQLSLVCCLPSYLLYLHNLHPASLPSPSSPPNLHCLHHHHPTFSIISIISTLSPPLSPSSSPSHLHCLHHPCLTFSTISIIFILQPSLPSLFCNLFMTPTISLCYTHIFTTTPSSVLHHLCLIHPRHHVCPLSRLFIICTPSTSISTASESQERVRRVKSNSSHIR